jgi:hypothetical protein
MRGSALGARGRAFGPPGWAPGRRRVSAAAEGMEAASIPAAPPEPPLLGLVVLDLPAKPDRSASELGDWAREVVVALASLPEGGAPDPEQRRRFRGADEIEANGRPAFGRCGQNPIFFVLENIHLAGML